MLLARLGRSSGPPRLPERPPRGSQSTARGRKCRRRRRRRRRHRRRRRWRCRHSRRRRARRRRRRRAVAVVVVVAALEGHGGRSVVLSGASSLDALEAGKGPELCRLMQALWLFGRSSFSRIHAPHNLYT
eukprot:971303-Pyramimonas_sp.AAC.2